MSVEIEVSDRVEGMPEAVRYDDLARAWRDIASDLGLDADKGLEVVVAAPRDLTLRQSELADSAWGGAWEWNLTDSITRTAVVSVLVAAALMAAGAGTGMAPVLIPTVLPLLFELKRVRLERVAGNYLRIIGARREAVDRSGTVAELYSSLPEDVRQDLTIREFEAFLGMAVEAGQSHDRGGVFEVLPNGENAFRINIR